MSKIVTVESETAADLPPSLPYSSKVALRLPELIKEAATVLSSCMIYEENSDETLTARAPTSMNNMLVELLWKGLEAYLPILDAEIVRQAKDLEPYRTMATYLMNNPSLGGVQSVDMPNGSAAHEYVSGVEQQYPNARWAISRAEALEDFASFDRLLSQLYATRETLTQTLAANPRPHR